MGPTVVDNRLVLDTLGGPEELPRGWTTAAAPGAFELHRRPDKAFFGFNLGQESWKKFLFPAQAPLVQVQRHGDEIHYQPVGDEMPPLALLGVRACELAALAVHDRVLLDGPAVDPIYARRRAAAFVVAVNCTEADEACFCASLGTGPAASVGFDLSLTELSVTGEQVLLVQAGSARGEKILARLPRQPVSGAHREQGEGLIAGAAGSQTRSLSIEGLPGLLYDRSEHPHWEDVAARCLSCGNCALVCPTCFCHAVTDNVDLAGQEAQRWRTWDTCHTLDHSYIHGGTIRTSGRSRYRQWLTHKLAAWLDQFGCLGCTGCGRCLVWCPAGIDLTAELRALRESPAKE